MKINKSLVGCILVFIFVIGFFYLLIFIPKNVDNIIIEDNSVDLNSLTLRQKIAQMIIVRGDNADFKFTNLNIGGIFLDKQGSEKTYKELIDLFNDQSRIKLFVATDMEGAWSPFFENFYLSPPFSEVQTNEEAFSIGIEHAQLLNEIGFNLNFAPVSEYSDESYGGRVFLGEEEEVREKLRNYIKGLNSGISGVCKHYPGKGMIKNLHDEIDKQYISEKDLELFKVCYEEDIFGIMVGHQIVEGELDSMGNPASVSKEVISTIPNEVLVISDEVNMVGLKDFYPNKKGMYVELINSGENIILDFELTPTSAYRLILDLEKEVNSGNINEENIDESVRKILIAKGYELK